MNMQDAYIADAAVAADAGGPLRLTTGAGCTGPSVDAPSPRRSACLVRGPRAHVFHVRTSLAGGRFLELGVYGGDVTVAVPEVDGAPAEVVVHAPLAFRGTTTLDADNVSLALAAPYVSPPLKLVRGAPVRGVAMGDRFRARIPFGLDFSVGPVELECARLVLDDQNRVETVGASPRPERHVLVPAAGPDLEPDPRDPNKLPKGVTRGRLHLSWSEAPLLRATPEASDGVRLTSRWPLGIAGGSADVELVGRRAGALHVRARTKAGSSLDGWIKESEVEVGGGGGLGEGIGLCGCGHAGFAGPDRVTLRAGAEVHAEPGGPVWARATSSLAALAGPEAQDGYRRIVHVDHVSEGGDGCDSERLEHAWVRAADVTPAPTR